MTSTQRVIVCLLAAILTFIICGLAEIPCNGGLIALVITIMAIITQRYRKEHSEDDE